MIRSSLPVVVLAVASGVTRADVVEQAFTYSWTSNDSELPVFSFEAFDDMGGARQLTGVTLGFAGSVTMEITAQTYDPFPLAAGEWSVEASHSVVPYFNGGDDGVELLLGLGGQSAAGITGDLGAGSGGFPFGEPGTPYVFSETIDFTNVVALDSSYFEAFSTGGPHGGFMNGFFDAVVTPPDNGQFVEVFARFLGQEGTFTLTYEYTNVPAPAGLALLGLGGLAVRRRR